ncbi:MAG: hypothetical protein ABSA79_07760 [Candidatus Bathyarchaeia archaeon]|jgi:hypothetical protein
MRDNNYIDFEIGLSQHLKLRVLDFSLRCAREDVIIVKILALISGEWAEIGQTTVSILDNCTAYWNDIEIESDRLRDQGIGSNTVMHILSYLKQNRIKRVTGEISSVDDVGKVRRFWTKNGFKVVAIDKPDGCFVAKIYYNFGEHS